MCHARQREGGSEFVRGCGPRCELRAHHRGAMQPLQCSLPSNKTWRKSPSRALKNGVKRFDEEASLQTEPKRDSAVHVLEDDSTLSANGHSGVSVVNSRLQPANPLGNVSEHFFDDLLALAAHICEAPVAIILFDGQTRCWCRGELESNPFALARESSFCTQISTLSEGLMVVPDTRRDRFFRDHPHVRGEPGIRFHASAPLVTDDGRNVGTLCVIDYTPHAPTTDQRAALARLSRQAAGQLGLRGQAAEWAQTASSEQRYKTLVETAPGGFLLMDVMGTALYATTSVTRLMGYEMKEVRSGEHTPELQPRFGTSYASFG